MSKSKGLSTSFSWMKKTDDANAVDQLRPAQPGDPTYLVEAVGGVKTENGLYTQSLDSITIKHTIDIV